MPVTPPLQSRRGSLRTRPATNNSQSNQTSPPSKPGTMTHTRTQQQTQHDSRFQSMGLSSMPASTSQSIPNRPGRPRKDPPLSLSEDIDKQRKSRGRPPKARDASTEPSTPPASESSAEQDVHSPPSTPSTTKDMQMDVDKEDILQSSPQTATRRSNLQRQNTRRSTSHSKDDDPSFRRSSPNSVRSEKSETPEQIQDHVSHTQVNEDHGNEEASNESDEDEAESDDDHRGQESVKGKQQKAATPSKRRLRSSKLMPSVVAHLAADSVGLTVDQIMDEYTEEQQLLRANASATEALARFFRQGIEDSESLHADMVDAHDYELIRHTFGEIEDLNFNFTGMLIAKDESSDDDDNLTKDLKRKHRKAKQDLMSVSAEYKEAKRSMTIQMSAQLDKEEAQIKAGTHPELLAELKAIEERRQMRIRIGQAQRTYLQLMWDLNFQAVCKAANDQYHAGQIAARKSIIEMVQNRMNRIKREMAQSKRMAAKSAPRRLTFVNPVEVTGYSSCDDDCSSYDSYSSSGSECSDCEICRPPRHLRIPQLKPPKGLNRREMALDLAFLFPQPQFNKDYFRATTELAGSQDLIGYSRQYNSEGEEPLRPTAKNQQYMIDHLNDERRRKRRVLDRELQNKVAYKKHPDDEKGYRIEGLSSNDMDVDQAQDIMYLEREASAGPSTFESGSRPHSPITAKSTLRSSLNRDSKSHQPRFLPGFGPDGMQSPRRTAESLPIPPPLPRYSTADRHGQSLDSNHLRAQEPYRTYGRDILPYPMTERDIPRVHGQWSGQEASWNPQSQTYIQQHLRQQEVHDAAYRSHQDLHLSDNDFSYKAPPPEDVYPFESERRIKFKHVFPQQRRLPPSPPLLPPPPQDPNRYQHPRVRPLKSKPLPLVDLADSQGQTYDRSLPPRGRPRMATSVRLTHQDGLNHNTGLRTGEGIESTHVNLYNSPAGTSRFKMQGQPYERFVTKPLTSTPPSSSMPPPSRATPWHHPYTGPPSSGQRHPHRHQPRSTSRQRLQQPAPRYSREPSTTPTFMDLTSPASSPKQSSATLPSPRMSVPTSDGNALMANGEQQNGLSLGADRIESQSTSTSPSHYIKEDPSDTLSKHDKTTVEID